MIKINSSSQFHTDLTQDNIEEIGVCIYVCMTFGKWVEKTVASPGFGARTDTKARENNS